MKLLPLPGRVVTSAFSAASVVHFARDIGMGGSAVLHSVLFVLWRRERVSDAVDLLVLFFLTVHLPMLVVRIWMDRRALPLFLFAAAFAAFWRMDLPRVRDGVYVLCHRQQLLVVVHALLNLIT